MIFPSIGCRRKPYYHRFGIGLCRYIVNNLPISRRCGPVLFLDSRNKVIAAVHARWKGTVSKIASKTVKMLIERFESRPQEIRAAIGPAIGACCYEVGQEVVDAVVRGNASAQREGKWYLDLPRANLLQLQEMGIADIDVSCICTSCRTDLFFSHRKEMGKTGRHLSFISIPHTPRPPALLSL